MLTAGIWLIALRLPIDGKTPWARLVNGVITIAAAILLTIYVNR